MLLTKDINSSFPIAFPPEHAAEIKRHLVQLTRIEGVVRVVVYGSYAKGEQLPDSDIDVAVFYSGENSLLECYRTLVSICCIPEADIQVQVFRIEELEDPCGIVEEIVKYGVDICMA